MNPLRRLWVGGYSLAIAFWVFFVGTMIGGTVTLIVAGAFLDVFAPRGAPIRALFVIAFYALLLVSAVGVWNSAAKGYADPIWMKRIWAILARLFVLVGAARLLWALANGGAMNLMALLTGR